MKPRGSRPSDLPLVIRSRYREEGGVTAEEGHDYKEISGGEQKSITRFVVVCASFHTEEFSVKCPHQEDWVIPR